MLESIKQYFINIHNCERCKIQQATNRYKQGNGLYRITHKLCNTCYDIFIKRDQLNEYKRQLQIAKDNTNIEFEYNKTFKKDI